MRNITHHLRIYAGVLARNKMMSVICLLGLSLALSSCIFISMFVVDELSHDSFHKNVGGLLRVSTRFISGESVDHAALTSSPLASTLQQQLPEVEDAVRFINHGAESTVAANHLVYREKNILKADSNVFRVFTFPLVAGDPGRALKAPYHVVLTESIAHKFFGTIDPLGKTIAIGRKDYEVSGIVKDPPENSSLKFSMLVAMDSSDYSDDWFDFSYYTYLLCRRESMRTPDFLASLEAKLNQINDDRVNKLLSEQSIETSLHVQDMAGLYFSAPLLYDIPKGNRSYIYLVACAAIFLLLIAALNYVSFTMVQSLGRNKEIGMQKVFGAGHVHLMMRHFGESLLFTYVSLLVALLIALVLLPFFNEVTSHHFVYSNLFEGKTLFAMAAMLLGVSLLAGSYPAFFMASISPVSALRNNVRTPRGRGVQKFSLACQYVVSAGLLICTAVLYQQMDFINAYDLGFRKENVMVLTLPTDTVSQQRVHALKVELGKHSEVSEVALTGLGAIPGQEPELGSIAVKTNDGDDIRMVNQNYVDENYLPALEIRLVEGRNFDGRISDFQNSILVNESFVRMMGWEEPLEHKIQWNEKWKNVIGVVTDFHYSSLYHRVDPQVIVYHDNNVSNLFIVLPNTSMQQQIADLAETWRAFFPEEPFVYTFLDDSINAQYQKEKRAVLLFTYFSVLTTVISCLGLFGLASLAVYQRKKEIGIRKIAGAGFSSLLILISKEYFRLILVALVVALPVSGLIMNQWLETFPYRGDMGIIVFIWVSAGVMVTALITIWVGISRISSTRPVDLVGEG